ncbi:MAG: hypothetical protein ACOVP6_03060 [Lacibacter sp.]|jgi:seryl-tRNA synthetase
MMKHLIVIVCCMLFLACENREATTTEPNEAAEASDTTSLIDRAQEKLNQTVDSIQSKGDGLIEKAGDSLKRKMIDPVKTKVQNASEQIKKEAEEMKEKLNRP